MSSVWSLSEHTSTPTLPRAFEKVLPGASWGDSILASRSDYNSISAQSLGTELPSWNRPKPAFPQESTPGHVKIKGLQASAWQIEMWPAAWQLTPNLLGKVSVTSSQGGMCLPHFKESSYKGRDKLKTIYLNTAFIFNKPSLLPSKFKKKRIVVDMCFQ